MEITSFEQFELNRQLLNAVAELGYTVPTPIQQKTIPLSLGNHDVLGIAQTGTGKTAAYLLPILMKVKYAQGKNPRALILAPTRELVMQINQAVSELGKYTDLRHLALYGGLGPKTQIETLRNGVDIIVATPGRFMDLYRSGEIVTKEIRTMVLDEADKMMDMGFMPQIRSILEIIPTKRQNLLFSATFGGRVERLSSEFLEAPIKVEVTPQASTADMVSQVIYEAPNFRTKINMLDYLMRQEDFQRVIIFARTKGTADNIYKFLSRKVIEPEKIRVIHANKGQNTRINAMDAFKEGNIQVLVSTDVAARGIDVAEVSHVINFDLPLIYEDYVHRIGRTGRANRTGEAITFLTKAEEYHVQKIERIIKATIPRQPLPAGVVVAETPFEEEQAMLREIDEQRRKEDPTFLGAFHEKKITNMAPGRERDKAQAKLSGAKKPSPSGPGTRSGSFSRKSGGSVSTKSGGGKRSGSRGGRR
ncbi:DEAD/DEAH box helicase [Spirosoma linguale]|uniref:DEAD/DEAH box helicase domain protein n=1 Tax=Spirosoma linguale (strain ATCC 33905 / DSM 74 / LMG 10896 / Claus 1) TaxID=504472 RepID=D2QS74_SPILD|nr:DEAD/DEAH box helicase domain protein [Spirosoma linguale DSM 74]